MKVESAFTVHYLNAQGNKHGEYIRKHLNGNVKELYYYNNDKRQGPYNSWHINKKPYVKTYMVNDKCHGEYYYWDMYGELKQHSIFVDGEVVYDFLKNPVSDDEKLMLAFKYGVKLLG